MAIDIYGNRKHIVLALALVKFFEFLVFHEVLIYWHIREVMKYWAQNITKCVVNLWTLIVYLKSTFMNYTGFKFSK